jgi:DNA-binding NtrC family response regulator
MASVSPLSVLIADPDRHNANPIQNFLENEGYQVTVLEDPSQTAETVKQGRYQMVFLDVSELDGGGVSAIREVRGIDDDLCIICTTREPDLDAAVAAMKHRVFDYLQHPVETGALKQVVGDAIKEHGLLANIEDRLNNMVGERVRVRRHELGLTLRQVANRTTLSVSLISQIELGRSAASVLTLYKLATALGVRIPYFFQTV